MSRSLTQSHQYYSQIRPLKWSLLFWFPTKILYEFLIPIRATCSAYLILLVIAAFSVFSFMRSLISVHKISAVLQVTADHKLPISSIHKSIYTTLSRTNITVN